MDATITDSDQTGVRLHVIDNEGAEHELIVDGQGTVAAHVVGDYPSDLEERTPEENERVQQVRRYARYHVYSESGEESFLPNYENPDFIALTALTVARMDDADFEAAFGDYREAHRRAGEEGVAALDLPVEVGDDDTLLHRVGIHVDVDADDAATNASEIMSAYGEVLGEGLEALGQLAEGMAGGMNRDLSQQIQQVALQQGNDLTEFYTVTGVSDVETAVVGPDGAAETVGEEDPTAGDPDAVVELPPVDPGEDVGEFRDFLVYHLLCQARDACIRMGIEPTDDDVKIPGPGTYESVLRYRALDVYEDYHDPDAEIERYTPA